MFDDVFKNLPAGTARILICGDRNWRDGYLIELFLRDLPPSTGYTIIEGECRGADKMARLAAQRVGIPYLPFPAKWTEYGKAAGPIRNKQMLDEGKPDIVVAFHDDLEKSSGTKNMIEQAEAIGLPVIVVSHQRCEFRATMDVEVEKATQGVLFTQKPTKEKRDMRLVNEWPASFRKLEG